MVNEYYLDGSDKSEGYSSKIDPPVYEGKFISYYANGHKKQMGNYLKGKLIDTVYHYYPNGKLYTAVFYDSEQGKLPYYITVKDSTGLDLTKDGVGKYVVYSADFKKLLEQGQIKMVLSATLCLRIMQTHYLLRKPIGSSVNRLPGYPEKSEVS